MSDGDIATLNIASTIVSAFGCIAGGWLAARLAVMLPGSLLQMSLAALMALAAVRELLGTGMLTIWVTPIQIFGPSFQPFSFMVEAPGAFMALGLMLCLMNLVGKK